MVCAAVLHAAEATVKTADLDLVTLVGQLVRGEQMACIVNRLSAVLTAFVNEGERPEECCCAPMYRVQPGKMYGSDAGGKYTQGFHSCSNQLVCLHANGRRLLSLIAVIGLLVQPLSDRATRSRRCLGSI